MLKCVYEWFSPIRFVCKPLPWTPVVSGVFLGKFQGGKKCNSLSFLKVRFRMFG